MKQPRCEMENAAIRVVGSTTTAQACTGTEECDLVEIRLDCWQGPANYSCFVGKPLLFTARRSDEGGEGNHTAAERTELLRGVLDFASCIDIEVASITEMAQLIEVLREEKIPWVASFHDFEKLPDDFVLKRAAHAAKAAGATVFKVAAQLHSPEDVARLARFQLQPHGIQTATMGMGELAVVSRMLCAQCGSVLNYGFLGDMPTAPGQWSARALKAAISTLPRFTR